MADKPTIEIVKKALESSKERNFEESIELAINLKDLDLSVPKNRIEEDVILPKGRGKELKIAVFASGELAFKSKKSADLVITPEEIEELAKEKRKFKTLVSKYNFFLAEAPLMPTIGKRLGTVLGPKGKMPRPIPPTIDPKGIVATMKNTVRIRSRDKKTFHAPIGTRSMKPEDLAANADVVVKRLLEKLGKGKLNIASIYVKTTMGPSVRLM
ncbi:MAG: 50S ribosomal protein L1 [Thermoplasmata archaeon]|nr:50S ribosomal protein L1 [Thermoplasmata archaeon]